VTVRPPSDDLVALVERAAESFVGRCVRRFLVMSGIDRCIVLSSQAFTALIPLLILVSALAPAGEPDVVATTLITKFGLSGDSADAVAQLFHVPESSSSNIGAFSALLVLFSGVSFTRRLQRMYRAAFEQQNAGVRSGLFAALGLLALLAEVLVLYSLRSAVKTLPYGWALTLPLTAATGLVLWTSIPYLLLNRQVHWRRLLVGGAVSALGSTLYGVATSLYMPGLVDRYTREFGLFGITIAIIGWLLAVSGILVGATAIGAEFDRSQVHWVLRLRTRLRLYDPAAGPPPPPPPGDVSGLTSNDLLLLVRVLGNWAVLAAAVWAATALVPGIHVTGGVLTYLGVSLVLGLVNAVLGPLLHLVALPLTVLTLGLFALVVNGVLLAVTAWVSSDLDVDGLAAAVLGAVVVAVVTTVLELVLRPLHQPPSKGGTDVIRRG
jgi:membrane protein